MTFVRTYNPLWYFVDLNGLQLNDTYWMFTLQNTLPYLPLNIFLDENGTLASDPIQFQPNGTLPDLYWDDSQVYRIEIRAGNTQAAPLIYVWNNYQPIGNEQPTPPSGEGSQTDNQITNPQFAVVNFTGTLALTASGTQTYQIAPGWQIITSGSGTCNLTQATYVGDSWTSDNATNASYGLIIQNEGFTSVTLRQRFNLNGALWTGSEDSLNPGIALNFTASSSVIADVTAELNFADAGTEDTQIITQTLSTTNNDYATSIAIPVSTSGLSPAGAWTDLDFIFTSDVTYNITSIQLIGQTLVQDETYAQTSIERQIDQMFHYYNPQLQFKPIPSLLTAWDFPLNPFQFTSNGSTTAAYVADQTIMQSKIGTITVAQNASTGSLSCTTANPNEVFYVLQYLAGPEAIKTTLSNLSVNVNAYATHPNVTVNCYLCYAGATAGSIPALSGGTIVASLSGTGTISLAANWSFINPIVGGQQVQTLPITDGDVQFLMYNGKANFAADAMGNFFGIVVTFTCPTSGTVVNINSISCVPADIATRPAPQTADEVFRECQYYWETSYELGTPIGTFPNFASSLIFAQGLSTGAGGGVTVSPFGWQYRVPKRALPTVTVYSPHAGTAGSVTIFAYSVTGHQVDAVLVTYWTPMYALDAGSPTTEGLKGISYFPISGHTFIAFSVPGSLSLHYVAEARLGIV